MAKLKRSPRNRNLRGRSDDLLDRCSDMLKSSQYLDVRPLGAKQKQGIERDWSAMFEFDERKDNLVNDIDIFLIDNELSRRPEVDDD